MKMAEAVVTLKLSPDELRTIHFALDRQRIHLQETVDAMSPNDGKASRQMILKMDDLKAKL